jgi:hypothetical protein
LAQVGPCNRGRGYERRGFHTRGNAKQQYTRPMASKFAQRLCTNTEPLAALHPIQHLWLHCIPYSTVTHPLRDGCQGGCDVVRRLLLALPGQLQREHARRRPLQVVDGRQLGAAAACGSAAGPAARTYHQCPTQGCPLLAQPRILTGGQAADPIGREWQDRSLVHRVTLILLSRQHTRTS